MTPIERAVEIVGGQTAMARALDMANPQAVHEWIKFNRVPVKRVLGIEAATDGRVTRHELRPDIYPIEASAA